MANQDSGHILADASAVALVSALLYNNASPSFGAEGFIEPVSATQVGETFTSMNATGSLGVVANVDMPSGLIQMSGELTNTVVAQNLLSAYVVFYGFLSSSISTYSAVFCADMTVDFVEQIIESTGCTIGVYSVALTRYRGDTYPVSTKLSKNGSTDVTGSTFQMSTQIADGTVYTANGVIENALLGIVNFPLQSLAIDTAGIGVYDIQGNDGTYDYTYEKGVFTLLEDVTP